MTALRSMPAAAFLLLAASLGALGFVFIMQYGFGVAPCELCILQRWPYAAAALLALVAAVAKPYGRHTQWLIGLCSIAFLGEAGLALFHSGVERHWWEFHSACTGGVLDHLSPEEIREKLLGTPVVRCDEISWTFLGLSMANWNVPFAAGLAGFAGWVARQKLV